MLLWLLRDLATMAVTRTCTVSTPQRRVGHMHEIDDFQVPDAKHDIRSCSRNESPALRAISLVIVLQPSGGNPDAIGYEGATVLDAKVILLCDKPNLDQVLSFLAGAPGTCSDSCRGCSHGGEVIRRRTTRHLTLHILLHAVKFS